MQSPVLSRDHFSSFLKKHSDEPARARWDLLVDRSAYISQNQRGSLKKEKEPGKVKEGNEQKDQKKRKGKGKRKKDLLEPPSKEAAPFNQEIPLQVGFLRDSVGTHHLFPQGTINLFSPPSNPLSPPSPQEEWQVFIFLAYFLWQLL